MVAIPERGDLRETPLPRLLIALHRARFNGSLRLERQRAIKTFLFQEGVPIFAESNLASETLGVQLMDAGQISREDHARVTSAMLSRKCKEGTALLELGLLEPKALFVALKEQGRQRVVDCFGWPQGVFQVEPGNAPPAQAQPFRADVYPLVQEGIETHWSPDRVLADLAPHMEQCVARTRRLSRIQERLRWDDAVEAFIDALDGTRTLWRALKEARTPRALAAAWLLDAAGAIHYPKAVGSAAAGIEIVAAEAAQAGSASRGPDASARAVRESDPVLVQEIQQKHESLERLDHYELLGLGSDAAPQEIRRAYLDAAKRYHPDTLARAGVDADTRRAAGQVFAAIGKAHAVLSDPRKRREYDARLANDDADLDAERLAAAETNYRKAEILLRTGNFRGALEYLRPAVDLWPEEAAYQAALGWALFKKRPSEPEEARKHLERAYEIDGGTAQTAFWLGTVLKALGETQAAENLLARARSLDKRFG
jgi:curved DNA-binding protein CbpA